MSFLLIVRSDPDEHAELEPTPRGHAPARPQIVGRSAALRRAVELVESAAPVPDPVLFVGEPGTGKSLLARLLHDRSPWRERPLITLPCAALPREAMSGALFGEDRDGVHHASAFERAAGGTLVLDEIAAIGPELHGRLTEALDRPGLGAPAGAHPARVVATTANDLRAAVEAGLFASDLHDRVSAIPIHVPPLRDRIEDLALLATHFAARAARAMGLRAPEIAGETLAALAAHSWPGNVRQLCNAVERAVILGRDGPLAAASFALPGLAAPDEPLEIFDLAELKRDALHRALRRTRGRRAAAARLLGISERTLRNMLERDRAADDDEDAERDGDPVADPGAGRDADPDAERDAGPDARRDADREG